MTEFTVLDVLGLEKEDIKEKIRTYWSQSGLDFEIEKLRLVSPPPKKKEDVQVFVVNIKKKKRRGVVTN